VGGLARCHDTRTRVPYLLQTLEYTNTNTKLPGAKLPTYTDTHIRTCVPTYMSKHLACAYPFQNALSNTYHPTPLSAVVRPLTREASRCRISRKITQNFPSQCLPVCLSKRQGKAFVLRIVEVLKNFAWPHSKRRIILRGKKFKTHNILHKEPIMM
jgi:hypothetical protein